MFPNKFARLPGRHPSRLRQVTAVVCFLFFAAPLLPQSGPGEEMQAVVLSEMHAINQLEIKAGSIAKEQGATSQVREYGDRLLRDHTKADAMVQSFAESRGIELMGEPSLPLDVQQKLDSAKLTMQRVEAMRGVEFDEEFLELMKGGHVAAITTLGEAHQTLEGTDLGGLIGKLLPILEQHYEIAAMLDIRLLSRGSQAQTTAQGGE